MIKIGKEICTNKLYTLEEFAVRIFGSLLSTLLDFLRHIRLVVILALTLAGVFLAQRAAELGCRDVGLDFLTLLAENHLHAALAALALGLVTVPGLVAVHTVGDRDGSLGAMVEALVKSVVLAHPETCGERK